MPGDEETLKPDPSEALKRANERFFKALEKPISIHDYPHGSPEYWVSTAISELKTTLSPLRAHRSFESELTRFLDGRSIYLNFITPDNQIWRIKGTRGALGGVTVLEKYENGQGSILTLALRSGSVPTTFEFSEGPANERLNGISDATTIRGFATGGHAFLMFEELAAAFQNEYKSPPPLPQLEDTEKTLIPDPINPQLPLRKALDPEGELDESFNRTPRFTDIMRANLKGALAGAMDLIDWEDPKYRGLLNENELDIWLKWQKEHKLVDEDGHEQPFEARKTYYYSAKNEKGEDVLLAVKIEYPGGIFNPRYVHVRELKETHTAELEDYGEVTSLKGFHASMEWRAPGIDSNAAPTTTSSMGIRRGDESVNPLTKWERAWAMLRRGRLIGFKGENGGITPLHRVPQKPS